MSGLYDWVRNISCYLIFMTVITNILPNKKYEKYIKLFAGMVLILIVMNPLTAGLRLDDQIARFFQSISLENQAKDLKSQITGMEKERLEAVIRQYEQAVESDVERMAAGEGYFVTELRVGIEKDQELETFGTITGISMMVTKEPPDGEKALKDSEIVPVAPVEPVVIGEGEDKVSLNAVPENQAEDSQMLGLKRKLAAYYNLEAQYVEIRLEAEND